MKTKLLLILILSCSMQLTWSQGTVPNLIVSEIFMGGSTNAFVELTNIGTEPADLSRVIFSTATSGGSYNDDTTRNAQWLSGAPMLAPGESFVVINHQTDDLDYSIVETASWYYPHADYWLWRTFRTNFSGMQFGSGNDKFGLFYDLEDEGSGIFNRDLDTLLDAVGKDGGVPWDVAGVANASLTHVLVRKADVTHGNGGDFITGAGVSWEDSDWIPIPHNPDQLGTMFTTIGIHTDTAKWEFSLKSGEIIDESRISMPWGAWRDSIYKVMNVGPNMAWHLRWGADTLESNSVQTGDTLIVYLCGDEVETRTYPITVTEPLESNNIILPRFSRTSSGNLTTQFLVTEDDPVIDTLFSIPFGSRIDSLFKYLEIASNASWEYKTHDGAVRAEVKMGDILEVTAKNGDKKEYYIKPDDYNPSDNAELQTILIDNDTLWNFSPTTIAYKWILSAGAQKFPSISATAQSRNARVVIEQPAYIRGTEEDRTATIKVVAEDDTSIIDYTITFERPKAVQPNILDPFISQTIYAVSGSSNRGLEIFNPSNVPISLGDYMLCYSRPNKDKGPNSLLEAISETDSTKRSTLLKFGYYFDAKRAGEGVYFKEATNYIIDVEPYSVFFIKRHVSDHWGGADFYSLKSDGLEYYGWLDGGDVAITQEGVNFWLLKATNDSIANGTKSADDINDWEFVDIWGTVGEPFDHSRTINGKVMEFKIDRHYIRKGYIWKGNTELYGSLDEPDGPGSSEWFTIDGEAFFGPDNDVRRHSGFIKPTGFMSTITSLVYVVSGGFGDNESIQGVAPGSTVLESAGNINKADPDQVLALMAADGSGERAPTDVIQNGDTLVVVSADLKNSTRYTIETTPLSSDALLTSDLYTIAPSGNTATIGTIVSHTTIDELLAHLTLPAGAFMNIIDNERRHVPVITLTPDTLLVVNPELHDSIFLEVIAEDGVTKILYSMVMEESDPYLTSNVYLIYQEDKVIDLWRPSTNIKTFMYNVTPSKGATIKVLDKYDYQRTEGDMFIDDKVEVTNTQSVSVTYTLKDFDDTLSVEEPSSVEDFGYGALAGTHSIYPNPATSQLNISGLETGSKVAVINFQGEIVQIRQAYSERMEIDLGDYSAGFYFIRVIKDQKSVTYKFIKQ